jgi:O-succinylbenzoate synthase
MKFLISTHFYTRRFINPLETGHGVWKVREGILIKLESEKGICFGEVAPIPFFHTETIDEARNFINSLGGSIDMEKLKIPQTLPCTAFAFSSAIAQINQAKQAKADRVFPVAGLLPSGAASKVLLASKMALGFKTFKWKIGVHSFEEEAQIFDSLIGTCDSKIQFRLDANASMSEDTLDKWMQYTQKYRSQIEFFEQPLPVGQESQMEVFSAKYEMPIALDESLNGPDGGQWLDQDNWSGLFVIKPSTQGSIDLIKDCLSKLGTRCIFSSSFETSIGLANCLELASVIEGNSFALGFDTQSAFSDDYSVTQTSTSPSPLLSLFEIKQNATSITANVF